MKNIKKFNELFNFKKKKQSYDSKSNRLEYRGYEIQEKTYPSDWKYDPEKAGKTCFEIWSIPADIHPYEEGEGTIETAKQLIDQMLSKKSPVYNQVKGDSPVYKGAKGTGILYTGESVEDADIVGITTTKGRKRHVNPNRRSQYFYDYYTGSRIAGKSKYELSKKVFDMAQRDDEIGLLAQFCLQIERDSMAHDYDIESRFKDDE